MAQAAREEPEVVATPALAVARSSSGRPVTRSSLSGRDVSPPRSEASSSVNSLQLQPPVAGH